ncbi:MAG TPA: glycoside hydrolase family 25 protein [Candidatus Paceibacterota bacterium]
MLVIDISNVNGAIDFNALKAAGAKGVFVKATEGVSFNDSLFSVNRAAAYKHGMYFGAYHFARPDHNDPVHEANHFCNVVKKVGLRDFKPVLDFETPSNKDALSWITAFNHVVKNRLGGYPIFYSYPAFITGLKLPHTVGNGLWLASYSRNDGKNYPFSIPKPWIKVVAHQFTSKWTLAGHKGYLDANYVTNVNAVLAHPWLSKL